MVGKGWGYLESGDAYTYNDGSNDEDAKVVVWCFGVVMMTTLMMMMMQHMG